MSSSRRVKCASMAILLSASGSTYAAGPALIALTGTATGSSAGGTFLNFATPVISSTGQVAFNANISGGTSTSGIFTGTTTSPLQAVALQGTAAPAEGASPSAGNFGNLLTSTSSELVSIGGNGELAFNAPLTGGTSTTGSFAGTSAVTLQPIALGGTAAPIYSSPGYNGTGTGNPGNYSAFLAQGINYAYSPVINASGQIALGSSLTGGNSSGGIFTGTNYSNLQTVAAVGGNASNGTYTVTTLPLINGNGQVAFIGVNSAGQSIYAQNSTGSIQVVMATGLTAPGTTGPELYGNPNTNFSINNAGQAGFQAGLTGGTATQGVFVGSAGNVQAVALNNTSAVGSGSNFNTFSGVTVNSKGRLAFSSTLYSGAFGLFVGTPSSVQAVALSGTLAPDGNTFASFGVMSQNGVGQVAFTATESNSNYALYGGSPGNLMEILGSGQTVDLGTNTGGSEFRTVASSVGAISLLLYSGGQDGKGIALDDAGDISYRVLFTDGSVGILESNVNTVPEPTSLGLLTAGAGLLLRRKRKIAVKPN